jgi:hypothetical protein
MPTLLKEISSLVGEMGRLNAARVQGREQQRAITRRDALPDGMLAPCDALDPINGIHWELAWVPKVPTPH